MEFTAEYDERVEAIKNVYGPKIEDLMTDLAGYLRGEGWQTNGPHDMSGDDYSWMLNIRMGSAPDDDSIDITIEIAEAGTYGDPPTGINFGMMIVEYGGRIIGQWTPFNYTERCWVDMNDDDAIDQRWSEFKHGADLPEIAYIVANKDN